MGREYNHTFGIRLSALGTVGVVGVGFASGPSGYSMLKFVEHFYVHIVGRAVKSHEFAEAVVVVILIGKFENRLACFLTQPHYSAAYQLVGPFARRHFPRMRNSRKVGCGLQVERYSGMVVQLQEGGGHIVAHRTLHGFGHDFGAVFAPCHGHYAGGMQNIAKAEGYSRAGALVALIFAHYVVAGFGGKQYKAAYTRGKRARLAE